MSVRKFGERGRIASEIAELKARYNDLMRGRMVPNARASALAMRIGALEKESARMDRDAAEKIRLDAVPTDEVLEIIAVPLLADVMNDFVAGVNATLVRHGVQQTVFGIYTMQIHKAAMAMVDTLSGAGSILTKLMADDTLVEALKKKLLSFIKQRLDIDKKKKHPKSE